MPIQISTVADEAVTDQEFNESDLFHGDNLTLEAQVISQFLEDLDYDALFDDPDMSEFVQEGFMPVDQVVEGDDDLLVYGDPDKEDVDVLEVEMLDGAIVAEMIDEDDLMAMFEDYVVNDMPYETLSEKAALSLYADMIENSELDEAKKHPFKKGDFRKGPMKGVSAKSGGNQRKVHNQRVRMMQAMLKKGVIVRTKKGQGYNKGDYEKGPGYKQGGTPAGRKMYDLISGKNFKRAGKIKKMVDPGRSGKVMPVVYKNLGGKMPKPWTPPEARKKAAAKKGASNKSKMKKQKLAQAKKGDKKAAAKSVAKKAFVAKRPPASGKGGIAASADGPPDNLVEATGGVALAGAMLHPRRTTIPLHESKSPTK